MNKDILIIGESCRDIFVYCDCTRLCPDIPVPALKVLHQKENEGMAKNVQRNIVSLGGDCDIITNTNWPYVTKTRYVHEQTNHMFMRVDTDHNIDRVDTSLLRYDYKLIVISDYNKGFLKESDIESICFWHPNVFIDTKKKLGSWANKAKFIKINNYEYERSKETITPELEKKIIRTKGGDGCVYNGKAYPTKRIEVKDTSGCGDTFLSGLVVEYIKSNDIEKSIEFANICASEVAQHQGVTTPNL
jgi:D-beta-D-heptose 7-phosphate kinase/D-beta-D-heptose 1-phosphate adenosyltransferase